MSPVVPGLCSFCPNRLKCTWFFIGKHLMELQDSAGYLGRSNHNHPWDWGQGPYEWCCSYHADFQLLFGLMLAERIFKHTDNLSCALQAPSPSAVEAQSVSKLCVSGLEDLRTDSNFDLLWDLVLSTQKSLGVSDPVIPQQCKRPPCYEEGTAQPHFLLSPISSFSSRYTLNFLMLPFKQTQIALTRKTMMCMQKVGRLWF
jgi:hypothetical protein